MTDNRRPAGSAGIAVLGLMAGAQFALPPSVGKNSILPVPETNIQAHKIVGYRACIKREVLKQRVKLY